ncbi:helix-turn-helix domain-containing protein [Rhodococcus sp. UNC363MFTsu5.1]|uniref:helix-turn-helix domain-containing protein n=1 Tax=Rhodococcus sp. UNC363MFTsu5.1 TaxID=1449069 RepID=UPI000567EC6A|nr:helix-turn-helix transcriptional regulator [Rhodococcus sp. UNC363MFTsu5.1]
MTYTPSTGQSIRHFRSAAGLTIEQLAASAEVSPAYLSRVENGKSRPSDRWVAVVMTEISGALSRKAEKDAQSLGATA